MQLLVPLVITLGVGRHLAYAGLMWLPLLVMALAGAWFGMDDLGTARSSARKQLAVVRRAADRARGSAPRPLLRADLDDLGA